MPAAVIFDMDGVIIDSEPLYLKVNREVFRELGIPFTEEEYNSYVGLSNREMWESIIDKHRLNRAIDDLMSLQQQKDREILNSGEGKTVPHVKELLNELREEGVPMAVASSSAMTIIEMILNQFSFRPYFQVLVSGEEMKRSKPAPDIFLHTAGLLNVAPSECVVIEDSANGVRAAVDADMKCVGFDNPNSPGQDLSTAHLQVSALRQLNPAVLKGLF